MLKIELTSLEKEELILKLIFFLLIVIVPAMGWFLANHTLLWIPKALAAGLLTAIVFKVFIYDPILTIYRAYRRSNGVR